MSYIQIEIGGKLRGLKFNQGTLMMYLQYADKENFAGTAVYALVWAALKQNVYVKRVDLVDEEEKEINGKKEIIQNPITFETVCDWVDSLSDESVTAIMNCFKETESYKKLIPKIDEDSKKKLENLPQSNIESSVTESPGE